MDVLQLDQIKLDSEIQSRVNLDLITISEYASAMSAGDSFPPIVVFFDGSNYWLADGFHRVKAATHAGQETISADVRPGDRRAAILYSVGANATHGLKRSNEDKRRAVMTLLSDDEWSQWSDSEIARQTKTSHTFVAKLRSYLATFQDGPRLVRRGDSVYEMNTGNIGQDQPLSEMEKQQLLQAENRMEISLQKLKQAIIHLDNIMQQAGLEIELLEGKMPQTFDECMYYIEKASHWQNELAAARIRADREAGKLLGNMSRDIE